MDSTLRARLHDLTLDARHLLTRETADLLEGVYGLHRDGHFEVAETLPALQQSADAGETRKRLERLLADEKAAGLGPREAVEKLTKEVAYTWLNRIAAFKMLEARKLIRSSVSKVQQSNGFMLWLTEPGNQEDYARYESGSLPLDALGEGPRETAYHHYLLNLCARMAAQIRVLFDPDNLPSRLFPRPRALAELLALVNRDDVADAWSDDETIGWIYQSFNAEELETAFREVRLAGKKFEAADIPAVTQLFTPRFVVRYLVENSLGRLWLQMHPDSRLRERLTYLVPDVDAPRVTAKPVREITLLDPACGTMHFGLVAFDLFAEMYREEIERAGEHSWPGQPSVHDASAIPAAIVEHNLFGIDIDLRAVQLSALTLYLKAAALNPRVEIRHSNLASADVLLLNGKRLDAFIEAMKFQRPIYERVIRAVWKRLRDANQLGSLLQLEEEIRSIVQAERERFRIEGQGRLPFPELRTLFEEDADEDAYWNILEAQIVQAFDEFARQQAKAGVDQTYFAGEATKGMRLLDVMLRRYDVVVTNPPYMSNRKMNTRLKTLVSEAYPAGKGDLYAAFVQRCLEFVGEHGRVGMLTMHSFMFISSYEELRAQVRKQAAIETLVHYGPALFAVGNPGTLQTAAYILRTEPDAAHRNASMGTYFRLVREPDAEAKRRGFERAVARLQAGESDSAIYRYRQGDFDAIPGSPWVYQITPSLRQLFRIYTKLGEIAVPRQGLATADNPRFIRWWWEVGSERIGFGCQDGLQARASQKTWFPHTKGDAKGGEFRRWWGNPESTVNWKDDGGEIRNLGIETGKAASRAQNTEYFFLSCLTYTAVSSKNFSVRLVPVGATFDSGGDCLFPRDAALTEPLLALLNSRMATYWLGLLNPTVNVNTDDIKRIPIPDLARWNLRDRVERAIALTRTASAEDETIYEFVAPPVWPDGLAQVASRQAELTAIEREIDEDVYRLYDITSADRAAIEAELTVTTDLDPSGTGNGDVSEIGDAGSKKVSETIAIGEAANGAGDSVLLARRWVSYAVGIVLGRFQPGVDGALGNGMAALPAPGETPAPERLAIAPIQSEVAARLGGLVVAQGIAVVESGHSDDLAGRVTRALELLVGEGEVEALLRAATGGRSLGEWLARDFFKEHVKQYRKRPIYWLLQSPKRKYGVYLFSERVTRDTLHLLRGNRYLGGRIAGAQKDIAERRRAIAALPQGGERRRAERELDALEAELTDLEAFDQALAAVTSRTNSRGATAGWAPELDDGILINLAPLYSLLPAWSAEPKQCWQALERGEYDWSHTAMRYWPDRVLAACRTNKSYAIAHGIETQAKIGGATSP